MGVTEGKKREKGAERILEEILAKNFHKLMKNINLHIQGTQQTLIRKTQRDPHEDIS